MKTATATARKSSARKSTSSARRSTPTQAQKDAALLRREKMSKLLREVAKMSPAQKADLFAAHPVMTPEGRALSCFNTCFLIAQRDDVTIVGGFQQWRKMGRVVRKGEKGLAIWFPRMHKGAGEDAARVEEGRQEGEISSRDADEMKFMLGTVFDISQTDAREGEGEEEGGGEGE